MAYSYRNLGRNGRLGNQLWQIAGTMGKAASEGDVTQAFFPKWQYAPYFSIPVNHFPETISTSAKDSGNDFLQDISLFSSCTDYVRDALRPSQTALETASVLLPSHGADGHRTAIHVRRGDYVRIGYWFPLCPVHYYTMAMDELSSEFPTTHFLVFSDDPEWCDIQFGEMTNVTVVSQSGSNAIEREMAEFTLMRSCDAFIISNSTFSWWAAYLSESDTVITPDRWYNEGLSHLDHSVFTPSHWRQRSIDPIGPYQPDYVVVTESPQGLIVTDRRNMAIHHLNAGASLIFELCTGSNSDDQITGIAQKIFIEAGLDTQAIDVQKSLDDLRGRGIVAGTTQLVV